MVCFLAQEEGTPTPSLDLHPYNNLRGMEEREGGQASRADLK